MKICINIFIDFHLLVLTFPLLTTPLFWRLFIFPAQHDGATFIVLHRLQFSLLVSSLTIQFIYVPKELQDFACFYQIFTCYDPFTFGPFYSSCMKSYSCHVWYHVFFTAKIQDKYLTLLSIWTMYFYLVCKMSDYKLQYRQDCSINWKCIHPF